MKIYLMLIFVVIFTINAIKTNKVVYTKSDELTLCNQLMYDVYYLKEENIAVHKRINHHVKEAKNNYSQIIDMFNATLKAQDVLESSQRSSSVTLAFVTTALSEMNEKIQRLEKDLMKLNQIEHKIEAQDTKLDNQILQNISNILTNNYYQMDKLNQELTNLKKLNTNLENYVVKRRSRVPLDYILGLSSANVTSSS